MRRDRIFRVGSVVVLVAAAVVGFVLWIPVRHPDASHLSRLVVTRPVKGFKAGPTTNVGTTAASPITAVKTSARTTPGQTGVYTVEWKGSHAKSDASLVAIALPTEGAARSAQSEAESAYLSQTSLTSAGYGFGSTLSDAAVPGAKGAVFVAGATPTPKASTARAAVLVLRLGRVVAVASAEGAGALAGSAAKAVATAEYRHLQAIGGSPTIAETSLPVVASVVYAVVALAVIGAVEAVPSARSLVLRRRRAAWEAAVRRERAARGAKVVKRRSGQPRRHRAHARR